MISSEKNRCVIIEQFSNILDTEKVLFDKAERLIVKNNLIHSTTPETGAKYLWNFSKARLSGSTPKETIQSMDTSRKKAIKSTYNVYYCRLLREIGPTDNTTRCSGLSKRCLPHV